MIWGFESLPVMIYSTILTDPWIALIYITALVFWLWMLLDCLLRPFRKQEEKLIWVIVIIFTSIAGAVIYYLLIKYRGRDTLIKKYHEMGRGFSWKHAKRKGNKK